MLILQVSVHVKLQFVDAFLRATRENARESIREPGVARFDVLQSATDPSRFVLTEVYRTSNAPAEHKSTPHYQKWRETVENMMAEPRVGQQFTNIFPGDEGW